mmetsp:Transcript_45463/g.75866  ORF Transcript_45463/g.75866 Transcript_45463/m.75866 type:complete len:182 (+) Transcript_45463:1587-2132(+)
MTMATSTNTASRRTQVEELERLHFRRLAVGTWSITTTITTTPNSLHSSPPLRLLLPSSLAVVLESVSRPVHPSSRPSTAPASSPNSIISNSNSSNKRAQERVPSGFRATGAMDTVTMQPCVSSLASTFSVRVVFLKPSARPSFPLRRPPSLVSFATALPCPSNPPSPSNPDNNDDNDDEMR